MVSSAIPLKPANEWGEDSKEYASEAPLQAEALPKCVSYHDLVLTTKDSEPQNTELRLERLEDIAPNNY